MSSFKGSLLWSREDVLRELGKKNTGKKFGYARNELSES